MPVQILQVCILTFSMIKVGLTGSIGSGKTTVASLFRVLGIPVYIADAEAKKFLNNPEVISLIQAFAGADILTDCGSIDRRILASRVFSDENKLQALNGIIHPRVKNHFLAWVESHKDSAYIVQEAAIIFESGFYRMFDVLITVTAPAEERIARVIKRDGLSRRDVLARMENQWSEESKAAMSDFVVSNSDTDLAIPQVLAIHNELLEKSKILKSG